MVLVSQSCRAARLSWIHFRQVLLSDKRVCRPSLGSGAPLTRPAVSSGAITVAIDCGRMPSARARLETVAEPSLSKRRITDTWDGVRSPLLPCSRSRRLSLPIIVRSSAARAEARSTLAGRSRLLIIFTVPYIQVICPVYLRSLSTQVKGRARSSSSGRDDKFVLKSMISHDNCRFLQQNCHPDRSELGFPATQHWTRQRVRLSVKKGA